MEIGEFQRSSRILAGKADDGARLGPEVFQPVVGTLFGREDVDDDTAEVEEHPAAPGGAFAMAKVVAFGLQGLFKVVGEGAKLEWRLRGGDHEVVRERRRLRDIDQRDVERLVFGKDVDGQVGEAFRIQEARSMPMNRA